MNLCCNALKYVICNGTLGLHHDVDTNEFYLAGSGLLEHGPCLLSFCPFCGNPFPRAASGGELGFDKSLELQEISKVLKDVKSVDSMFSQLGQPDRILQPCSALSPLDPWVRRFEYSSRWPIFRVRINEYADGSLRTTISAKGET